MKPTGLFSSACTDVRQVVLEPADPSARVVSVELLERPNALSDAELLWAIRQLECTSASDIARSVKPADPVLFERLTSMGVIHDFWPATAAVAPSDGEAAYAQEPCDAQHQPARRLTKTWRKAVRTAIALGRADLVERWRLCLRCAYPLPANADGEAPSSSEDGEWWTMVARAICADPGSEADDYARRLETSARAFDIHWTLPRDALRSAMSCGRAGADMVHTVLALAPSWWAADWIRLRGLWHHFEQHHLSSSQHTRTDELLNVCMTGDIAFATEMLVLYQEVAQCTRCNMAAFAADQHVRPGATSARPSQPALYCVSDRTYHALLENNHTAMIAWLAERDAANARNPFFTVAAAREEDTCAQCQQTRSSAVQFDCDAAGNNIDVGPAIQKWLDSADKICYTNPSAVVWIASGQVGLTYRQWLGFAANLAISKLDSRLIVLAFDRPWFKPFVETFVEQCLNRQCVVTCSCNDDITRLLWLLKLRLNAYCAGSHGDAFAGALLLRAVPELLPIVAK